MSTFVSGGGCVGNSCTVTQCCGRFVQEVKTEGDRSCLLVFRLRQRANSSPSQRTSRRRLWRRHNGSPSSRHKQRRMGLLHDAFVSAHNTANAPLTRSSTNISLKNDAKRALLTNLRLLAGIVQQAPGMTNSLRDELGLSPRGLARTPIPPPTMAPGMELQTSETVANVVTVRLSDPESPRRGKPDGVGSAAVYSFTGETPPTSLAGLEPRRNRDAEPRGRATAVDAGAGHEGVVHRVLAQPDLAARPALHAGGNPHSVRWAAQGGVGQGKG